MIGLKPINKICPVCGNGNYMRSLEFVCKKDDTLRIKCINCNSYFTFEEVYGKGDYDNSMDELELLIQQKKEIERKIRILKNQSVECGLAKIDMEHYPTQKPDRHYLAVHYKPLDDGRERWQTVFSANNRQSVIDAIPSIVESLQNLYMTASRGSAE